MKLAKLVLSAALSLAASAQADTFNYAYTFLTGGVVTGSFDGTAYGNLVTGLSNIVVRFNGVALNGGGHSTTVLASVSFDGKKNDFTFTNQADVINANDPPRIGAFSFSSLQPFVPIVIPGYPGPGGAPDLHLPGLPFTVPITSFRLYGTPDTEIVEDTSSGRWTLLRVSPVPEPEAYALMLAGLGLIGAIARRRRLRPVGAPID